MTEFYPGSRDGSEMVLHHYHHNYAIPDTWSRTYKQPQPFQFNTVEPEHRNHVRRNDLHLMKSLSYPLAYNNPAYRNYENFYTEKYRNNRLIFNLSSSYSHQQSANLYVNETMPIYFSPSPLTSQMSFTPVYRNPHMYTLDLNHRQIHNGGNMHGMIITAPRAKNRCKPANHKENKHLRKVKNYCTKLFAPLLKIFPVIRAVGSFASRSTDVGTDVLFTTHLCSITGSCDCVWTDRGMAYGWPPWEDYNWGPTACWQTCSQYQTLETSVTNATNVYPTHHCFAKESESGCSASPPSLGLVHPMWCNSAIAFIIVPLLIVNFLYIYKARHLHIFKKIPVLLILLAIVPIFHFMWPLSYILQPLLGESAAYCHSITITTRIVGALFESVPQFCLQNFVIMQSAFSDVVGIDNAFSPMAYVSVILSLCSNAYAVTCFMGKGASDKIVKFCATFITVGVRVTVNSMYGRHTFGLFMYALPMATAFLFICICNFLYGLFCCKYTKRQSREHTSEIETIQSNTSPGDKNLKARKETNNEFSSEIQTNEDLNLFHNTWKTLGMYIISAICDGFTVNGLLAWIAFMPWAIWPFIDNLSNYGMAEPGFTISVSVLSVACAGFLLNIVILICNRCKS